MGGGTWTYLPRLDTVVPAHTLADSTENVGRAAALDQSDPTATFDLPPNAALGVAVAVAVSGGDMIVEVMGADY